MIDSTDLSAQPSAEQLTRKHFRRIGGEVTAFHGATGHGVPPSETCNTEETLTIPGFRTHCVSLTETRLCEDRELTRRHDNRIEIEIGVISMIICTCDMTSSSSSKLEGYIANR